MPYLFGPRCDREAAGQWLLVGVKATRFDVMKQKMKTERSVTETLTLFLILTTRARGGLLFPSRPQAVTTGLVSRNHKARSRLTAAFLRAALRLRPICEYLKDTHNIHGGSGVAALGLAGFLVAGRPTTFDPPPYVWSRLEAVFSPLQGDSHV